MLLGIPNHHKQTYFAYSHLHHAQSTNFYKTRKCAHLFRVRKKKISFCARLSVPAGAYMFTIWYWCSKSKILIAIVSCLVNHCSFFQYRLWWNRIWKKDLLEMEKIFYVLAESLGVLTLNEITFTFVETSNVKINWCIKFGWSEKGQCVKHSEHHKCCFVFTIW